MYLFKLLSLLVVFAVSVGHATDAHEHHDEPSRQAAAPARALPGVQGDLEALERHKRKPLPL